MWNPRRFYKKFAPTASTTSVSQGQGRQGITVRGRDFLTDVEVVFKDGAVVSGQSYDGLLDPQNVNQFPWMSKLAKCFSTYKFLDLKLIYEPQVPSITNGVCLVFFEPDPTADQIKDGTKWNVVTQKGVNVHGSVWARHVLSVPQSLCASRSEYYTKETMKPLGVTQENGTFGYDPLEYYCGRIGYLLNSVSAPTALFSGSYAYGKLYIEYSIVFGKAENNDLSAAPVVSAAYASKEFVSPLIAASTDGAFYNIFRSIRSGVTAIANPQILIGENQADPVTTQDISGYNFFTRNPVSNELTAAQDLEFVVVYSLHGTTGAWAASNTLRIGIKPLNSSAYTEDTAGVLSLDNGDKVNERYSAGLGGNPMMVCTAVKLMQGSSIRFRLVGNGTIAAWATASPGYSFRFYNEPFGADAAPYP